METAEPEANQPALGVPLTSVVWDGFCVPHPIELEVKKKAKGLSETHFEVHDVNGNLLLQVDSKLWSFPKKKVMRDPAGFPILSMREKGHAPLHKWIVHGGESTENQNLLYSVQRSQMFRMPGLRGLDSSSCFQFETRHNVFLANNPGETEPDFHVLKCYSPPSQAFIRVYQRDTLVAEAKDGFLWSNCGRGREEFMHDQSFSRS